MNVQPDLSASNTLADLADRIRAEHTAAAVALKDGLQHAIAAGDLLIEAKAQVPHGRWLPWLTEHCAISERTAQAYMRVARSLGKLGEQKRNAVADLSFRDALQALAVTSSIVRSLPPASVDRVIEEVAETGDVFTLRQEVRRARFEEVAARHADAQPPPSSGRIVWEEKEKRWTLIIGPDITKAELEERIAIARENEDVASAQQERDEMIARAKALEAEAKALRKEAGRLSDLIHGAIRGIVSPIRPFTKTYSFWCKDEAADAEIAALPTDEERLERLFATAPFSEGTWGDIQLMWLDPP
jgi:hypothetical protein